LIFPDIIAKFQSAFVSGRLITDNALLAFESFHYMRKKNNKGKKGYVALKLDMSKAYDRIEWIFFIEVLRFIGFSQKWHNLIFNCISTVLFSVLLDGSPCQKFYPQRGLRQGDPLSPYLFILCAEVFSWLLNKVLEEKGLHGIQIARGVPKINLFFFFLQMIASFFAGILFKILIQLKEFLILTNMLLVNLSIWINPKSLLAEMYMMILPRLLLTIYDCEIFVESTFGKKILFS